MKIFPAIDLKDNKCVRLTKGKDDTSEVFMIYDEIAEKTVNALNKVKIKDVDISS